MGNRQIIQHFRTNELNLKPNSSDLVYGEIAINYKKDGERLFFKNDNDEIVEIISKNYVDSNIDDIKKIIEDDELITATAINKIITSSGFDEGGNSTLDGGISLTNAIENLQNEWGHQGPQGANGAQGANGTNGSQGAQGPKGTNGTNGTNGSQGPQGVSGTNGIQGPQGPRGIDLTYGNYLPLSGGTMNNQNVVTNLNADLLDGYDGSAYSKTGHSHDDLYYTESEIDLKFEEIDARGYVTKSELTGYTTDYEHTTLSNRVTTVENYTVPDARNKVLWIGTSIPAGDIQHGDNGTTDLGSNNYPKMVADALGFTLYNNARGSSFVCFYPSSEDGTNSWQGKDWSEYSSEVWKGYSLAASHAQIDEKFVPLGVPEWLINSFKRYSYESLIIPYIDGTIASCDTVIIDHGYNDRAIIINEASWHPGEGETQFTVGAGRDWLLKLQDPFEKTLEAETYFQGKWWNDESVSSKKHYMSAMIFLVKKIWAVNPKIKIIIGNYFTSKSNVFGAEFGNDRLGEFVHLANSAIASWLRVNCVEVWHHTGLYNRNLPAGNDYQLFCPDGVHPHSDSTGHSNKIIAGVYINAIRGTLYI